MTIHSLYKNNKQCIVGLITYVKVKTITQKLRRGEIEACYSKVLIVGECKLQCVITLFQKLKRREYFPIHPKRLALP